ncbi:MAG: hypothetical protein L6Q98_17340 [Anaerolineae bacterium]|nr:hypothetical protein [Anaerolineae bacterium]NUQ04505.1 hypothetical protein [Anaerolineae bacterium]
MSVYDSLRAAWRAIRRRPALLLIAALLLSAFPANAQDILPPIPMTIPTLIPAPGAPIEFTAVSAGQDDAVSLEALRAQGFAWTAVRFRPAGFAFPEAARANLGRLIAQLHESDFGVLIQIDFATPPTTDAAGFLNFLAEIAVLQPEGIQIGRNLNDGSIAPENYVGLMRQAFAAIKRASVETLVISGILDEALEGDDCAQACSEEAYRAALAAAGLDRFADCIAIGFDASSLMAALDIAAPLNAYAVSFPDKPLCVTAEGSPDPDSLVEVLAEAGRVRLLILDA